jgi:hypothetical protein|eukprot:CAMPEP_0174958618 /NCGR_PEP_ID=MMETSP0004_2-20121128/2722_1 /TAXON_ID=420556 /ORGANISM="Ochromonas sp., Strain CCMP1393" /LENGTH=48 /DNA_ID= /DNA_START= /DNA_END= /DNA_ORIENTATION=
MRNVVDALPDILDVRYAVMLDRRSFTVLASFTGMFSPQGRACGDQSHP